MLISSETVHTARGTAKMAKSRKVKAKAARKAKSAKAATHAEQYAIPTSVSDRGTYERWVQQVGVEVTDEANTVRREVFPALRLHDRVIDDGGRVVAQGSVSRFEHPALDVMLEARVLDDPADPERAHKRVAAGVELLRLAKDGKVLGKSTTAWGAVGGGSRGIVSAVQAESYEAYAEMRYLKAKSAVGAADWDLVRMVCIDGIVPRSISRSRLTNALDLLGEYLLNVEPPATVRRPPMRVVPPRLVRRQS
jgi:hypothetical protein